MTVTIINPTDSMSEAEIESAVEQIQAASADQVETAEEIIDEAIEQIREIAKVTSHLNELKEEHGMYMTPIDEQIRLMYEPEDEINLSGTKETLHFGANAKKVEGVDKDALMKAIGMDVFLKIANVSIGDIRKYCNPMQLAKILDEQRTGKRTIKIK